MDYHHSARGCLCHGGGWVQQRWSGNRRIPVASWRGIEAGSRDLVADCLKSGEVVSSFPFPTNFPKAVDAHFKFVAQAAENIIFAVGLFCGDRAGNVVCPLPLLAVIQKEVLSLFTLQLL